MLLKRRWPNKNFITLFTSNSKFRLNLTQRVTGSQVFYNDYKKYKKQNIHFLIQYIQWTWKIMVVSIWG